MNTKHWALIAGMCGTIGAQLLTVNQEWNTIFTPMFIGTTLIQIGITVGAIYVGPPDHTH